MDDSPLDEEIASKAKCIMDIIFNPSKTKLMSYNKNSYNGLLMLIFKLQRQKIFGLIKYMILIIIKSLKT